MQPPCVAALKRITAFATALFALLLGLPSARAQTMGVVIEVVDGDTICVLVNGKERRVHLAEVDAPERGQKYTETSRKSLHDLVFGKTVKLLPVSTDPSGTSVAYVRLGQVDASLEQVKRGMAWPHDQFVRDKNILAAGAQAKRERVGLWRDPQAVPPWVFRKEGVRALAPVETKRSAPAIMPRQPERGAPHRTAKARAKFNTVTTVQGETQWRPVPYRGESPPANKKRAARAPAQEAGVAHSQVDAYLRQIQDAQSTRGGALGRR